MPNQNPEQIARDNIDKQLIACGWIIQNRIDINLNAGTGIAIREYQTDTGPADYMLFVDKQPVGVIEAKKVEEGSRFTDYHDPKPRSRPTFTFHKPETFREWQKKEKTLRKRLLDLPLLPTTGLRDCQIIAIRNLEKSFKDNRPRALIQMATGSGKTYTAITSVYRLLKHADAKRILFLVDTKNLGEQAEQELSLIHISEPTRL